MKSRFLIVFLLILSSAYAADYIDVSKDMVVNTDYAYEMNDNVDIILNTHTDGHYEHITLQWINTTNEPQTIYSSSVITSEVYNESYKIKLPQNVSGRIIIDTNSINTSKILYSTLGWYVNLHSAWLKSPDNYDLGTGYFIDDNNEHTYILAGYAQCDDNISQNFTINFTYNETKIGESIDVILYNDCPNCTCNPAACVCNIDYDRIGNIFNASSTSNDFNLNTKFLEENYIHIILCFAGIIIIIVVVKYREKVIKIFKKRRGKKKWKEESKSENQPDNMNEPKDDIFLD